VVRQFFEGQPVVFNAKTHASPIAVLRLSDTTLEAAIFQIDAVGEGAEAFSAFRGAARSLARKLDVTHLELGGIAIYNKDVVEALTRHGFTQKTVAVPEALGGGTTEAVTRRFPVRRDGK
jgi:hypothetical protein